MTTPHHRKKQPELVRRSLIDCAGRIVAEGGVDGATIQAVAAAAGVTKGGLLHHFPSKQLLIEALFVDLLEQLAVQIDHAMEADEGSYGRFTRAYLQAMARLSGEKSNGVWAALCLSMRSEKPLRAQWSTWLDARLKQHAATDADPALAVLRYAADGIWLADLMEEEASAGGRRKLLALIDQLSRKPIRP